RAVRSRDVHFSVMACGYLARRDFGHGKLVVGHKSAVRTEHFDRAAKPLVRVPHFWLTSPQFGGVAVEVPNRARGINAIDGHGTQVEQGAITLLRLEISLTGCFQLRLRMRMLQDWRAR